ncbi:tRNA preQ1(34) S-adenosylmethionine ribosyltransferase-isomerase QueA [Pontibacter sp. G13]|uniref:tRNA preQ1(34) S-adenosylmethionine ribosyltransferase-isomerase QueA n=1 Tax=Pontibacter sp. G13 TaxID=3074898 RepID=UPI00288B18FE|nr:tRNA preQ1(34) S-adenosylmethionine ribosyltransferase-isomerase QueA [Pontibacter sp. G13]WNJ21547.1 tRNA preQ1(34) S-adenosylmethionine ribosyltransferase-isomerase QueA [Pontibacter sp. G13]
MKLSAFNFEIPENLTAQYLAEPRDSSRMLVAHRDTGKIEHRTFRDILDYFDEGDTMVLNDTKVFPARLIGKKEKTGARIEVFLLRELNARQKLWDVLVEPARKIRVGNKLYFGENDLVAEVVDNTTSRGRTIRFLFDGENEELHGLIDKLGLTPIPPYIEREVESRDRDDYQTVFARNEGAVAAPTAGLHFTREMLKRFELKGVEEAYLTLHVGIGTFNPVEVEDLSKHRMDSEFFQIPQRCVDLVNDAKRGKRRVLAVGTSVMRSLESSVSASRMLNPVEDGYWTDKFIYPPYEFNIANAFLTNFHRPKSTLLMMVAAFMGYEFMMECYEQAIKEEYRFYGYGDAMLII